MMNHEQSLKEKCQKAQLNMLNEREGKHDKPEIIPMILAIGSSGIEFAVAFYLLLPAGLLIATIAGVFPVALLWAMANYQADQVEFVNKCDELIEEYGNDQI